MNIIKTPFLVKRLFPSYVWSIDTAEKVLYLTFDDGPTPDITEWTLNTLKQYNAKATFFCIGKNVEKHPEIFNKILSEGHSVGNHAYNHLKGWTVSLREYLSDVNLAETAFKSVQKSSITCPERSRRVNRQSLIVNLFRPPYGKLTPRQGKKLREKGYKIVMWDVISYDWDKTVSQEECLNNVISKAKKGSVVVFHDSVKAFNNMQYALPKVLDYFSEKGFGFEAL